MGRVVMKRSAVIIMNPIITGRLTLLLLITAVIRKSPTSR